MATFFNQATLSYNGTVTDSNIVTGEIVQVLSASKTAISGTYNVGDTITYAISIINSGSIPFADISITDNLGEYGFSGDELVPLTYVEDSIKYFSNGILQAAPDVLSGPPLSITGINVPAMGNVMIIYEVTVNQYAPLVAGGTITNEATISGDSILNDIVVTETVSNRQRVLLTITKSLTPQSVVENGELTYTFVIQNFGSLPATEDENIVVTDTFNPVLNGISATYNGAPWAATNYTYNPVTGLFQTIAGEITVPAATFVQDPATGQWNTIPGVTTLTVTGTI